MPFLQKAVKHFELTNPSDGEQFPSILPREALPTKPDPQMIAWHDTVSDKLMIEAQASTMRNMPPRPQMALNDANPADLYKAPSGKIYSSIEAGSVVGAAKYFPSSQKSTPTQPSVNSPSKSRGMSNHQNPYPPPPYDAPWSPLRRRSSMPPDKGPQYAHPSSWNTYTHPPRQPPRPSHHTRTPSTLSSSSFTSDSSYTTSSASAASASPVLHSTPLHPPSSQYGSDIRRSQSLGYFPQAPGAPLPPRPQFPTADRRQSLGVGLPAARHSGEWSSAPSTGTGIGRANGLAKPNERGLNVRWPDQEFRGGDVGGSGMRLNRSATVRAPVPPVLDRHARTARSADGRRSEREREKRRRGESVGHHGRDRERRFG